MCCGALAAGPPRIAVHSRALLFGEPLRSDAALTMRVAAGGGGL